MLKITANYKGWNLQNPLCCFLIAVGSIWRWKFGCSVNITHNWKTFYCFNTSPVLLKLCIIIKKTQSLKGIPRTRQQHLDPRDREKVKHPLHSSHTISNSGFLKVVIKCHVVKLGRDSSSCIISLCFSFRSSVSWCPFVIVMKHHSVTSKSPSFHPLLILEGF